MSFKDLYITEMATGLTNREEGDIFKDTDGILYKFNELVKSEEGKEYKNIIELNSDIQKEIEELKLIYKNPQVIYNNKVKNSMKSYMIAVLTNQKTGVPVFVIRYTTNTMNNNVRWSSGDLKNTPGLKLTFANNIKLKQNVQTELVKIADIYKTETPLSTGDIIAQTEAALKKEKEKDPTKHLIINSLLVLLNDIASGGKNDYLVKNAKQYGNVIAVSLAEIVAPFFLLNITKGNNKNLTEQNPFEMMNIHPKKPRIVIPKSQNNPIIDTYITDGTDVQFGISSKAIGGGAETSLNGVYKHLTELRKNTEEYNALKKKYKKELAILDTINKYGRFEGPVVLANELGIISKDEMEQVHSALVHNTVEHLPDRPSSPASDHLLKIMDEIKSDKTKKSYRVGFHLLSAVAKLVVRKLNAEGKLGELVKEIMLKTSFVQAKCRFVSKGEDIILKKIEFASPVTSKFIISSNKNYFASDIKDKLSFKMK